MTNWPGLNQSWRDNFNLRRSARLKGLVTDKHKWKIHVAMNAYLFSAGCTTTAVGPAPGRGGQTINTLRTWDGCSSAIIYGGDAEQAQKRFET